MPAHAQPCSCPASVAPHPLLRGLADPGLELALHRGRDPFYVVGLAGGAGHLEFFELDLEAALLTYAQAARHPDAGPEPARDHGGDRHGRRRLAEEGDRQPGAIVQVTDEPQAAPITHEAHDPASGGLALLAIAAPTQEAARVEEFARLAHIAIYIGVLDGAIDGGRIVASECERPNGELPIAHVERDADGGAELVLVAVMDVLADDFDAIGFTQNAVDLHGLGHHTTEVLPHGERDPLALGERLLGKGDGEVFEGALMTMVKACEQTPRLGRHVHAEVERNGAQNGFDEPQGHVFGAVAKVLKVRHCVWAANLDLDSQWAVRGRTWPAAALTSRAPRSARPERAARRLHEAR